MYLHFTSFLSDMKEVVKIIPDQKQGSTHIT